MHRWTARGAQARAAGRPELAVGAVAEDGTGVLDGDMARRTGMTREILDRTLERESRELRRRTARYRDGRAAMDVGDRTVIVVDDGLATGLTDLAAVRALRAGGASRIIVAAPVGSRQAVARLFDQADEVVCHTVPRDLWGVGQWYRDFSPVGGRGGGRAPDRRRDRFARGGARRRRHDTPGRARDPGARWGSVLFAHGSGSSRRSARNRAVAATLQGAGLATLLFDLLSEDEGLRRELVFDVTTLAQRLKRSRRGPGTSRRPVPYHSGTSALRRAPQRRCWLRRTSPAR